MTASGVSRHSFYDVFESREQCLLAAYEEGVARAAASVLPAYRAQSSWLAAIRAGVAVLLETIEQHPALAAYCLLDAPATSADVLRRRAEVTLALANAIDAGRAEARERRGLTAGTARILAGGVLATLHDHMLADEHAPLGGLQGELTAAIVRPYLGDDVAASELARASDDHGDEWPRARDDRVREPLAGMRIRWTYRTLAVMRAVAADEGASNRAIGEAAGMSDPAQTSRLLARLQRLDLIENQGGPASAGLPNAWHLTPAGAAIARQLGSG